MNRIILLISIFICTNLYAKEYSVLDFGVKKDLVTDNAELLQKAIDSVSKVNGVLVFEKGTYYSGSLVLKDNTVLKLKEGSVLKAIPDTSRLKKFKSSVLSRLDVVPWKVFLFADGKKNIKIIGKGKIDASGGEPCFRDGIENSPNRHYGLFFVSCNNIEVRGIEMISSAFWMQRYLACKKIHIERIKVYNHANKNNDGLDLDSSKDIVVKNCTIDASDDALVIKSNAKMPCKNIVIDSCILSSHASVLKFGTGSVGGYENIKISNIRIVKSKSKEMLHPLKVWGGLAGIELLAVDGGALRNVKITNVYMEEVLCPIHIRLGNRLSGNVAKQGYGVEADKSQGVKDSDIKTELHNVFILEDVAIENVVAKNVGPYPIIIAGFEGANVKDITMSNIKVELSRAGNASDLNKEPNWKADSYPFIYMYGTQLPAYGIVTNFTEDVNLKDITITPAENEIRTEIKHY